MSREDRSDRDPLQSLIAEILDAESRGEAVDRDSLLAEYPDHTDSLREFFAISDLMKSAADVYSPTLPPQSSGPTREDPTIAPTASPLGNPTLPPTDPGEDDATLLLTEGTSQKSEPTVGDKVRYFGDYELLEEIARGGMGVVYKARQMNLNRIVALKMILAGQFAGQDDVQRFYTEAEAAASLDHPGIVPIFEIGEHADQHYFSMGYVEGESLAEQVADGPLPPREAAQLVAKVCDAMAYAHERGVIHRDLKPANILIERSGQPRVTDFGLAKNTETDSQLTGTGQILGTPAYMPPEQASSKGDEVGPLADVYSIGAVLYCLLTGRPPFQSASPMDTLLQVLDSNPIPVRQLVPTTPRDLETICAKCLSKDPAKRYASAKELSDDLNRFLANEPIEARPAGWVERASKWASKQPTIAAVLLSMPAWMLGEPKIGVGLLGLVAGFHLTFHFRWVRLPTIFVVSVIASMAIGGWIISQLLANPNPGSVARVGATFNLAITTPFFIALQVFLWDCMSKLEKSHRRRARRWLMGSIVGTIVSVAGLLVYLNIQGQEMLVVSEQLAKEQYATTTIDSFSAFGGDSSSAQTQLARGRMFLWFPALAGAAWIYLVWGVFAGRLIRRFVYLPAQASGNGIHSPGLTKTVDGDVSHWVAVAVTVACAVLPVAVNKLLRLYHVDFSRAFEGGTILDAMMFISFAAAWLAAYAVASRRRRVIASVVGGCLVLFLAASTSGTIASRMYQYLDPPPHSDASQTAIRWDGVRTGLVSPLIELEKENGITIEGWIKPEGIPKTDVGCNPILVENTGFGNITFGIKLKQSLNWVAAIRQVPRSVQVASAPDKFAFDESLETAEWTHFAAVIHGDMLTLFLNGKFAASETLSEDLFFPKVWVMVLGGHRVNEDQALVGLLDEVRISDTARYESDFSPQREWAPDEQTVLLYHFDATTDGIIYDYSGNKHHIRDRVEWVDVTEEP
ncbi:MAG: protein kinase [Pirellulales bacterium]